jgi:hypothetical protein
MKRIGQMAEVVVSMAAVGCANMTSQQLGTVTGAAPGAAAEAFWSPREVG